MGDGGPHFYPPGLEYLLVLLSSLWLFLKFGKVAHSSSYDLLVPAWCCESEVLSP